MNQSLWGIFAHFPLCQSQKLAQYTSRACAEQDAIQYRRIFGEEVAIEVIFIGSTDILEEMTDAIDLPQMGQTHPISFKGRSQDLSRSSAQ